MIINLEFNKITRGIVFFLYISFVIFCGCTIGYVFGYCNGYDSLYLHRNPPIPLEIDNIKITLCIAFLIGAILGAMVGYFEGYDFCYSEEKKEKIKQNKEVK